MVSLTATSAADNTDTSDTVVSNHEVHSIEKNTTVINKEKTKNIKTAKSKIYVSPNGNDKATGLNNNPYKTITKAITVANNNDEIILNDGTYTISNVGKVDINKNITIKSNNKQKVIIQAKTSVNDLFFINPSNSLSISNVQFKNINRCSVFANKGKLSLTNVDFISNSINKGGNNKKAIVNNYGTLKMDKCYFEKNKGYNGSALYNVATATITNSNIRNGNALFGGAIYSHYGTVVIRNSNITANTVNGSDIGYETEYDKHDSGVGGAIYNRATMQIHNTILQYNKIPYGQYRTQIGGAIANYGKLLFNNSRILNTYAMGSGAIYNSHTLNVINSVINNNLEQLAKNIFNEYFIKYEFPNESGRPYKTDKGIFKNSSLGLIPEKWEVKTISEFTKEMKNGGTPRRGTDKYWVDGKIPWLKTGEINNTLIVNNTEFITQEGLDNSSAKLLPINSVIMAMYGKGTAARVGLLKIKATTNQACCAMICNSYEDSLYLYMHLLIYQQQIETFANGSVQQNLNKDIIGSLKLVIPDERTLKNTNFKEIFNKIHLNLLEIEKLTKLRDTLLPKLMSGEIDVSEINFD